MSAAKTARSKCSARAGLFPVRNATSSTNAAPEFRGARFQTAAEFQYARFGAYATFEDACFDDAAEFSWAEFGKAAWFAGATFERARFHSTRFAGPADFGAASFAVPPLFDLARARLDDGTDRRTWPDGYVLSSPVTEQDGQLADASGVWGYVGPER
ncbi:pentapeptide repeat-containing protein [Amycolatopsis sp. OK19-0408]|uniref:Pentapeptide repeat-containing protein n=1 Tax=Amycolatopsis iheyensis TaxID=2945988 RepID=A0A9X2SRN7_9PSEU|nr:pentapeptide repeat-containing protein [Amycolatopsis iheyensis]MCR6490856.1 pentapeptide repeat-containing protein [Amycolatopsis iheyensis]